jgi:hypothetical protein
MRLLKDEGTSLREAVSLERKYPPSSRVIKEPVC